MSDISKNNDEVFENTEQEVQSDVINTENTSSAEDNFVNDIEDNDNEDRSMDDTSENEDKHPDDEAITDNIYHEDSTTDTVHDELVQAVNPDNDVSEDIPVKSVHSVRKIKYMFLVSVISVIALLIVTDIIPILPNAYNRFYVGNKYQIGETQGGVFDKFAENVLYAGNGVIISFGENMSCDFKIDAPAGTPKIETSGNNAVVYYANTNDAVVVFDKNSINPIKTSYEITASTVNRNGYYGFVTKEPGYKSYIEVFDKNGKSIYKFHTNNFIIDIAVSDNGKSMVASGYELTDKEVSGKLFFIDLTSDKPGKETVIKSNLISEVKFVNKDTAVAFGDSYTTGYTSGGIEKWKIKYGSRAVKSYDVSPNGDIAFIFDRYTSELSESTVEIYSQSGKVKGVYNSKDNVKYVSANNDYFLLSLDKKTVLLDSGADVVKNKNTAKDFRRAVLYSNYNFAFSITDGISEVMSVKH